MSVQLYGGVVVVVISVVSVWGGAVVGKNLWRWFGGVYGIAMCSNGGGDGSGDT